MRVRGAAQRERGREEAIGRAEERVVSPRSSLFFCCRSRGGDGPLNQNVCVCVCVCVCDVVYPCVSERTCG